MLDIINKTFGHFLEGNNLPVDLFNHGRVDR